MRLSIFNTYVLSSLFLASSAFAQSTIRLYDEGTLQGTVQGVDCIGSAIACAKTGVTGTLTLSGAGGGAPTDATYWTGSANGSLSAEYNLGALATGLVLTTAGAPSSLTAAQGLAFLGAHSSLGMQVFTTPGANTYTPSAGMKSVLVISTGGGGGGGGADATGATDVGVAGGGGAGGTVIEVFSAATIGASQTCTVGAAGTGGSGTGGTTGGTGGTTTFGALHSAVGGVGAAGSGTAAKNMQTNSGGTGGVPTGGTMNITGGNGFTGHALLTLDATEANEVAIAIGGQGGVSFWGSGGHPGDVGLEDTEADSTASTQAGEDGLAYGSGGGGSAVLNTATGVAGGDGMSGVCMILEFM